MNNNQMPTGSDLSYLVEMKSFCSDQKCNHSPCKFIDAKHRVGLNIPGLTSEDLKNSRFYKTTKDPYSESHVN